MIKLLQHDWNINEIFAAYPDIRYLIINSNDTAVINSIPKRLIYDFLSLVQQTEFKGIDAGIHDRYFIENMRSILKCCSIKMYAEYVNKILKIRNLSTNDYG